MRAFLSGLGLLVATSAFAGEVLVADPDAPPPAATTASSAAAPGVAAPAPVTPAAAPVATPAPSGPEAAYPTISNAPLFGRQAAGSAPTVDESALRFYAQGKNYARVDAEIRRLKELYPAWKPPANPYAAGGAGDGEQPLWDLLGAGRVDDLRRAVKARQLREPGWVPSAQLTDKQRRLEAVTAIAALSDAGNWVGVLETAARAPDALTCATVDSAWRVAEAFARTGRQTRATDLYGAVLTTCRNKDERLATLRKALLLLPADGVQQLIASGERLPDGTGEFDGLRVEVARRAVGQALGGTDAVPADLIDVLKADALKAEDGADAALLGWFYLGRKSFDEADNWFKVGLMQARGDAKLVEGRAAALRGAGRLADAEQLARAWRDKSASLRALYVALFSDRLATRPATVERADLADFEEVVNKAKDVAGAQALAWSHLDARDWPGAVDWFRHAYDWAPDAKPDGAKPDRAAADKLAEGYALALRGAGRTREALDVVLGRDGASDALRALAGGLMAETLSAAPPAGLQPDLLDRIRASTERMKLPGSAAALGWYQLARKDASDAAVWFKAALDWRAPGTAPDAKGLEGYVLALRGANRADEAAAVVTAWRDTVPAVRGLMLDAVVDGLARDPAGIDAATLGDAVRLVEADHAPQSASALAWHFFAVADFAQAERWFKTAITRAGQADPDPKNLEGLALTLRGENRAADALAFAAAWSERLPTLRPVLVDIGTGALGAAKPDETLEAGLLARLDATGQDLRSAPYASARAWYGYAKRDWHGAADWFGRTVSWAPDRKDPKIAEGYGLALHHLCRYDEAKAVTLPWIDLPEGKLVRVVYINAAAEQIGLPGPRAVLDRAELLRLATAVTAAASANGAQALGWYALRADQYRSAAAWFTQAMAWGPTEPTAFGLALAERKLGDRGGLVRVLGTYAVTYPVLDAFRDPSVKDTDPRFSRFALAGRTRAACAEGRDVAPAAQALLVPASAAPDEPAPRPPEAALPTRYAPLADGPRRVAAAPDVAAGTEAPEPRHPVADASLERSRASGSGVRRGPAVQGEPSVKGGPRMLGWFLLNHDRPTEAALAFRRAQAAGGGSGDDAFGETLALLRTGDTGAASAVAARASLQPGQRDAVESEILWRRVVESYDAKRWREALATLNRRTLTTAEGRPQLTLRGWSLYQLGDYDAARLAFGAADRLLSDDDSRRALAVVAAAMNPKERR